MLAASLELEKHVVARGGETVHIIKSSKRVMKNIDALDLHKEVSISVVEKIHGLMASVISDAKEIIKLVPF